MIELFFLLVCFHSCTSRGYFGTIQPMYSKMFIGLCYEPAVLSGMFVSAVEHHLSAVCWQVYCHSGNEGLFQTATIVGRTCNSAVRSTIRDKNPPRRDFIFNISRYTDMRKNVKL